MKKAIQLKENIYWVGVRDFQCRDFHGSLFPIEEGTTYNAYLIVDDQITLIDTVEDIFFDEMMERIQSVIADQKIDNIIVQHGEPDHSGGYLKLLKMYPDIQAYTSKAGVMSMMQQYFSKHPFHTVKTKDTLSTGKYTFTFVEMPLIHWPDNMLTYLNEEKIVFSNDAFGQHICRYDIFDDAYDFNYIKDCAKNYFANIVMPYCRNVQNKLKEITAMHLEIDMIAPAHGIILHKYVNEILEAYVEFSSMINKDKAIIVYESVWHHTQMMANALAEGLGDSGIDVRIYACSTTSPALIMKELLDAKAIFIGSGNYNNSLAPSIAAFLEKITSCKLVNKKALGFGSYGWANVIVKKINERLVQANIPLLDESIQGIQYTPSDDQLNALYELGKNLAQTIKEI